MARSRGATDRALLERFACADMTIVWQAEVQTFIQQQLFDWAFDPLAKEQVLMSSIVADVIARVPPRAARIFAVVHEDNARSLALCRRHGLTEELSRPHPAYRRLVTP